MLLIHLTSCRTEATTFEGWLSESELELYGLYKLAPLSDALAMEDESRMFSGVSEEAYIEYAWNVYSIIKENNSAAYSADFNVDNLIISFRLINLDNVQELREIALSEPICMVSYFYWTKNNRLIHTMLIYYPNAHNDIPAGSLKISFTDQTISYGDKPFID